VKLLLCLWLVVTPISAAPPPISGRAVETEEDELARRVADSLRADAERRAILARRIQRSSIAESISAPNGDPEIVVSGIADWIRDHPDDAARLSLGFAKDDYYQNHKFEESLRNRIRRYFELNPERDKGILGALKAVGSDSKMLMGQQGERLAEEEQREILKRMFEGRGLETDTVLTKPEDQGKNGSDSGAHDPGSSAVFAAAGIYDRLSALNPTGYSPAVVTYQSALNARRVPGAPKLIENGRLDYPTLAYPSYSLRFDLDRLRSELSREESKAPPDGLAKRKALLESAARSIEEFQREATKARDKTRITPTLLRALGRHQREAARWLTAASLQGEMDRTKPSEDFLTEELRLEILRAPVPEPVRQAYLFQAERLRSRAKRLRELDAMAMSDLEGSDYLARWDDAAKRLAQGAPLRRRLSDDINAYVSTPYALNAAYRPKPRWRVWLEKFVLWVAPNSALGRRIQADRQRIASLGKTFLKIASGR